MKNILWFLISVVTFNLSAQINKEENSVQTIAYWDLGETQEYEISYTKSQVKNNDTISKVAVSYEVDITVKDSTENSYTIEWIYKNHKTNQKEEVFQNLTKASDGLKILFKTDEMGSFLEVLNLNEIQNYIQSSINMVKANYAKSNKELENLIDSFVKKYTTKESVESLVLRDIQLFHTFHGGYYTEGEVIETQMEVDNLLGGKPFVADVRLVLEEIIHEEYNYLIKFHETVEGEQLKEFVNSLLSEVIGALELDVTDKQSDINLDNVKQESYVGSIIHDSGWVVYTYYTKSFVIDNHSNIETLIIEIK